MPLHKNLNPNELKSVIRNINETYNLKLNQYFYFGSFTGIDRVSSQAQLGKKQTHFTLTKLNTVQTGLFIYQSNIYD